MHRPRPIYYKTLLLVGLILAMPRLALAEPASDTLPPSPEQIQLWIDQLASPRFSIREEGMQYLIETGPMALPYLTEAIMNGSLEVISRGVYVLQEWAFTEDSHDDDSAIIALEQIATSDNPAAANQASLVLQSHAAIRKNRAIAEIVRSGGDISEHSIYKNTISSRRFSLVIEENWQGDADTFRDIEWIPRITQIQFEGEAINDQCLEYIGPLPNVTNLSIKKGGITDEGLAALANYTNLVELKLYYNPLSDNAIAHLIKLESLASLQIYGSSMTDEGLERLKEALPNTRVDFRRGGFLGISCITHERGCALSTVSENSAASRAGLRPGDVITLFAGEPVIDFDSLILLIGRHKVGESVSVQIYRDGEVFEREIRLGEWE